MLQWTDGLIIIIAGPNDIRNDFGKSLLGSSSKKVSSSKKKIVRNQTVHYLRRGIVTLNGVGTLLS
jgi:hypothetical protein